MNKKTLAILLLFLVFSNSFGQSKKIIENIRQVENNLIPYVPVKGFKGWNIIERMKYYNVPGVSIAVIKDFAIAWAKGYGLADTIKKIPVTTETMFSAGSISKFLSAVTAIKLVQDGRLQLDSPINNYLTSWKIADNEYTKKTPVTLRMLLSHTAGSTQSAYFGFTPGKNPLPSIVEILSGAPVSESRPVVVNSQPNKEFRYSGGGSMIAQLAMMDVSQKSFSTLTQQVIFDTLGMKNSTFEQPLPKKYLPQASQAYSSASWFKGMPYVYPQQAAAGLYSTPTDLAKFFIDVQKSYKGHGKILQKALAEQMLTAQVAVSDGGYKEQMAVGPFLLQRTDNKEPKGIYFEFTGVNAGFLAYGIANLIDGNGVVIMLNSGDDVNGLGKEVRRAVAKIYNWYKFLPDEILPINLTNADLDKYVGRYRKSIDEVIYLKREKNYLVENINKGANIYCFPISKDTIIFTDYNIKGGFGKDETGNIISLQTQWQQEPMPRMKYNEFTPSEFLKAKKYKEAKEGFRQMKMNQYQITYLAYDLSNKKPADTVAVRTILDLALEQHPNSAIVYNRWGDYHLLLNDKGKAMSSYRKALELDPADEQTIEKIKSLADKPE